MINIYPDSTRFQDISRGKKAVFTYKLFATNKEWLPKAPVSAAQEGAIVFPRHHAVGGMDQFVNHYLGAADLTYNAATHEQRTQMQNLETVRSVLNEIDATSTSQMLARLDAQADGLEGVTEEIEHRWSKAEAEAQLEKASTQNTGNVYRILTTTIKY
jgi:hypothetical protein